MIRWVAALHGSLKETWDGYYEPMVVEPEEDENYTHPMVKTDERYEDWWYTDSELIPTKKGKEYESIFESWIRVNRTPYRLGSADLKATHWVMSVLTKRSIGIKCKLPL